MANEAIVVDVAGTVKGGALRFACDNNVGIEKYTLLKLSGNRTVAASTAAGTIEAFAGIAAEEKVSGDGATSIGVYTSGIFRLCCGIGAPGSIVKLSGANQCTQIVAVDLLSGLCLGRMLETSTATLTPINVAIGIY